MSVSRKCKSDVPNSRQRNNPPLATASGQRWASSWQTSGASVYAFGNCFNWVALLADHLPRRVRYPYYPPFPSLSKRVFLLAALSLSSSQGVQSFCHSEKRMANHGYSCTNASRLSTLSALVIKTTDCKSGTKSPGSPVSPFRQVSVMPPLGCNDDSLHLATQQIHARDPSLETSCRLLATKTWLWLTSTSLTWCEAL